MDGHPVAAFQLRRVAQQGCELIDPDIEFLIGDVLHRFLFELGDKMDGGLVLVVFKMAVDAVVAGVQLSALKPLETGGIAGIEDFIPVLVPGEQLCKFCVVIREVIEAEPPENIIIRQIGLADEFRRRGIIAFFLPVNCDLRF